MLWKKTGKFWTGGLAAISFAVLACVLGCGDRNQESMKVREAVSQTKDDTAAMEKICLDLYKKAAQEQRLGELETIRAIVQRFGEYGYPAVDSKNQVNMTEAEQVVRFCEAVEKQETAVLTVFEIDDRGGFVKYDLQTAGTGVEVQRSYYQYKNKVFQRRTAECYRAEEWKYTKEGYLMFSGTHFSKERYALTLSTAKKHTALRVAPLDETYREWNREYILPVGYAYNNMFLTDWNEDDFGELNFYDMYDIFYEHLYRKSNPYTNNKNVGISEAYKIPRAEFEQVLTSYFAIDGKTLQSKTVYCQETGSYEYIPRGIEEAEYPEYPYPEVFDFTENDDGTITLFVRAVFPYVGDSCVYVHEVVVRPLENGGMQYVSNRITNWGENGGAVWHTPRRTPGGQEAG